MKFIRGSKWAQENVKRNWSIKNEIIEEFKNKKIEPSYYNFLEKRIEEYIYEIKEQIDKKWVREMIVCIMSWTHYSIDELLKINKPN